MRSHSADLLVIDDTVANLRLLRGMLGRAGYRVRVATSASFGLEAARSQRPDLILLDLGLPDRDGLDLFRELKQDPHLLDVPVMILSATTEVERKVEAFRLGASDYVTKPFSPEEVLARIETQLRMHRYQDELESANHRLDQSLVQLSSVQAQRDRVMSMLVHDLRSPLTAVSFSLDGLRGLPPEAAEAIEIAQAATRQATDMIEDLIQVRDNQSGFRAELVETRLDRLVHDVVWLVRPTAPGLEIEVQISAETPTTVRCDRDLLARVISNLLAHALRRATDRAGIQVFPVDRGIEVRVFDDGPPIPEAEAERIFDLYYTGTYRGRGMGLPFCRLAVEAHEGSIQACKDGERTAICFQVPL